ncbi:MAG TPA: acyltransferase, partial [Acetobacteraceae bacterium]
MSSKPDGHRISSRLDGVEAARGIAAVLVAMVHATGLSYSSRPDAGLPFGGLFLFAHAGVDFFFVLSGFIIYRVHRGDIGSPHRLSRYAWRRFVRIYPTYWIILAGFGLLLLYSPEKDPSVTSLGNTIASTFLLPRFQRPIIPNAWTLRHELIFYVLFGLLILNRHLGRILLAIWAALIAWNVTVTMWAGAPFFGGLLGYLPFRIFNLEFFFGMGVALLLGRRAVWCPRLLLLVGVVIFLGDGLLESFGPHVPIEWPPRHLG